MQPLDSIHVTDAASLVRIRREITNRIFGRPVIRRELPTVSGNVLSLPGCSPCTFTVPANHNRRLAVVHQGHTPNFTDYGVGDIANDLQANGFIVARCVMPNPGTLHDANVPLKDFLRPVFAAINHFFLNIPDARDVVMTGLSGGGWTTTLCAALDWRIRVSVPVAGSLPLYMNPPSGTGRDWEQFLPGLEPYTYLDLYLLACSRRRTQLQILHTADECCFSQQWLSSGPDYYIDVRQKSLALGGEFARDILDQQPHAYISAGRQRVTQEFGIWQA